MTVPCTEKTNIALVIQKTQGIEENTKRILNILEGNGSDGLVVKVALNKQAIKRAWWWLGAVSTFILGVLGYILKEHL